MANPDNITLRSEKGSFITFEEMDLNLLTLRTLIEEVNALVSVTIQSITDSLAQLQLDFGVLQSDLSDRLDIVEGDLDGLTAAVGLQGSRISNLEEYSVLLNGNNSFTGANSFAGVSTFLNEVLFNSTGAIKLPVGTTAQRTTTPINGLFRYNSDTNSFEGYSNGEWGSIGGGAAGGAGNAAFWENDQIITSNYTITSGKNAGTFGPVTIANGVTVNIPDNSVWTIV